MKYFHSPTFSKIYRFCAKNPIIFPVFLFISTLIFVKCSSQSTTYSTLKPETKYVGNQTCASCHKRIYDSYIETGMGKSFYRPDKERIIEKFDGQANLVYDAFSNFYYQPFWQGTSMYVREFRLQGKDTTYNRVEKIDYIVGSGHQTRSYILERNNYFYEVPITWYVSKQIWDLSPGYDKGNNSRFSREIGEECMACHTGNFEFVKDSKNRFHKVDMGIDCERCHGAGEEHIRKMAAGEEIDVSKLTDFSIVNPKKLSIDAQFDVCQQCHLQGTNVLKKNSVRDFRPSMNLEEVYDVFLEKHGENEFGIASHASRLKQSKCFLSSNGKLTCTTCHDPHKSIHKTDSTFYIKQCQSCHQQKTCKATMEVQHTKNGNCVSCHLLKGGTNDIPHVSFHDHKIRVLKEETKKTKTVAEVQAQKDFIEILCASAKGCNEESIAKGNLQYFETHNPNPKYLALAEKNLPKENTYARARLLFHQNKLTELSPVMSELLKNPNVNVWFLAGEIAEKQGDFKTAYTNYENAYQMNTESVEAGLKAATMMLKANVGNAAILPQAQKRLETLLKQKPFDERILSNLGFVLMNSGNFPLAEKYLKQALSFNPDYVLALENLTYLFIAQKQNATAKNYFQQLIKLKPDYPNKGSLEKILNGGK